MHETQFKIVDGQEEFPPEELQTRYVGGGKKVEAAEKAIAAVRALSCPVHHRGPDKATINVTEALLGDQLVSLMTDGHCCDSFARQIGAV